MVKIRLMRTGAKKQPYYRIVVAPSENPRDSKNLANLGTVNPRQNPPQYDVEVEQAIAWLDRGAQPTDVVRNIFKKVGVYRQWLAQKAEKTAVATATSNG